MHNNFQALRFFFLLLFVCKSIRGIALIKFFAPYNRELLTKIHTNTLVVQIQIKCAIFVNPRKIHYICCTTYYLLDNLRWLIYKNPNISIGKFCSPSKVKSASSNFYFILEKVCYSRRLSHYAFKFDLQSIYIFLI